MEKKKTTTYTSKNFIALYCAIALVIGAGAMFAVLYFGNFGTSTSTIINRSEKEVTVTEAGIADAVEKLYDSVVVVNVYKKNTMVSGGTGFVYKKDEKIAYILTNAHVVNASNVSVKVKFTNDTEEEVKIVGYDDYLDIAVLSIDASKVISVASIGKSESMRVGDTVFTIGAPINSEYYWTVTRGILSGKDRMIEVRLSNSTQDEYVMKVLQTDASINSGNSGGPLANSNGEVVGITNMKHISSGVEGIGFAIPIDDAIPVAESIINNEEIKRPKLGVSMINLTDTWSLYSERISINTELQSGVVVAEVQKNSPADAAGLKRGDIIVSLGDGKVKDIATLRYCLFKHKVGDTVTITYERDGKMKTSKLTLNAPIN